MHLQSELRMHFFQLCGCVSRRKSALARLLRMDEQVGGSLEHPTVQFYGQYKKVDSLVRNRCDTQYKFFLKYPGGH